MPQRGHSFAAGQGGDACDELGTLLATASLPGCIVCVRPGHLPGAPLLAKDRALERLVALLQSSQQLSWAWGARRLPAAAVETGRACMQQGMQEKQGAARTSRSTLTRPRVDSVSPSQHPTVGVHDLRTGLRVRQLSSLADAWVLQSCQPGLCLVTQQLLVGPAPR